LTIPQGEYRDIQHLLDVMAKTINDFIGKVSIDVTQKYETKMVITLDAVAPANHVKFEFKPYSITPLGIRERLTVTIIDEELAIILGSNVRRLALLPGFIPPRYRFYSRPQVGQLNERRMGYVNAFPAPPSKTVTIETRMQISGDVYDASGIFGVPSSVAPVGKIVITPEITIRELALAKDETNNRNKIKVNEMLDDYLGFSQIVPGPPPELKRISDYGVLNFTGGTGFCVTVFNPAAPVASPAITTLDAVDLSKIVSKVNNGEN